MVLYSTRILEKRYFEGASTPHNLIKEISPGKTKIINIGAGTFEPLKQKSLQSD